MATEAAWLNGNNCEKEEINEAEKEKKRKDERKVLTLTGLLMEGLILVAPVLAHFSPSVPAFNTTVNGATFAGLTYRFTINFFPSFVTSYVDKSVDEICALP